MAVENLDEKLTLLTSGNESNWEAKARKRRKTMYKTSEKGIMQEKITIGTDNLKDLAIYLSGVKDGKGNLLPLGTIVLDDLWNAIKYLQGDVRITCPKRDDK